jgi:O-antigen ligase
MTDDLTETATRRRLAIAGGWTFGLYAGWTIVTATAAGSSAGPTAGLVLASGLVLFVSWFVASRRPWLVPAFVVGATMLVIIGHGDAALTLASWRGLLGYANATAALLVQATFAGVMVFVTARSRAGRIIGATAAGIFATGVILTGSVTAAVMMPTVFLLALLVERIRGIRAAIVACGCVFGVTLLVTLALGASGLGTGASPVDHLVRATISSQRVTLWGESLSLMADDPLLGVGPERFAQTSPTAVSDADLRWAHNEFLQAGAESGILGYLAGVGIFIWGFVSLYLGSPARVAVVAACALAVLGVHASVDYVLHFPTVALTGAALLGTGLGARRPDRTTVPMPADRTPAEVPA